MSHGNQSVQGLMLALEHFTALLATLCSNIIAYILPECTLSITHW